mmetsp:Transcript_81792/g.221611  ORF Transcript_81792/g.221611 Transcript_81792/m.221611 type:complete len:379 (+) Transcript_81792:116-1252(+)
MPRLPLYRCLGFQSGMCLSASPFLPCLSCTRIRFLRSFSILDAASSLATPRSLLCARALEALAAEAARVPSGAPSEPAVASRFLFPRRLDDLFTEADLPRILAALTGSTPPFVRVSSTSAAFLFRPFRPTATWFFDFSSRRSSRLCRILLCSSSRTPCVSANFSSTCSSSLSLASATRSASSLSSSASFLSMSGSTKSITFLPSMISGTTSYFQLSSSSSALRHRSVEYTPAPPSSSIRSRSSFSSRSSASTAICSPLRCASTAAGMHGGRLEGAAVPVMCRRFLRVSALPCFSFCPTRFSNSMSHALPRAASTPSRVTHEVSKNWTFPPSVSTSFIDSMSFRSSSDSSLSFFRSVLLRQISSGRFLNSGLIEWKSAT